MIHGSAFEMLERDTIIFFFCEGNETVEAVPEDGLV